MVFLFKKRVEPHSSTQTQTTTSVRRLVQ